MSVLPLRARCAPALRERGLTLVELMVALTIGLVIVLAMTSVFVTSSTTRREIELSADVLETGRYAIDVLGRELTQTGFYGSLHDATVVGAYGPSPETLTGFNTNVGAVCSTNIADWAGSLPIHVVGLRSAAGANVDVDPGCLARKAGTDAIFIQRVATCTTAECGPEVAAKRYLQVSECGAEYTDTANGKSFAVVAGLDASVTRKDKLCAVGTASPRREIIRRIFYINTNDVLSYVDITPAGAGTPVALADNIEQIQFAYGLDGDANNDCLVDAGADFDGTADSFCAGPKAGATTAQVDAFWSNVVGVRIWLLARSTSTSANITSATSYVMDDTTINVAAGTRGLKRRIYTSYVSFISPKARREQ